MTPAVSCVYRNPNVTNFRTCRPQCWTNSNLHFYYRWTFFYHCYGSAILSQGSSWLHVGTDQPFKSISVGAASQVWATARDGSAFYRGSVSPQSPAGQWIQDCNSKRVKQQPVLYFLLCGPLQEIVGITSPPHPDRSSNRCLWGGPQCTLWMKTVKQPHTLFCLY